MAEGKDLQLQGRAGPKRGAKEGEKRPLERVRKANDGN